MVYMSTFTLGRNCLNSEDWRSETLGGAARHLGIRFGEFLYGEEHLALHHEMRGFPKEEVDYALHEGDVRGRAQACDEARGVHAFAL